VAGFPGEPPTLAAIRLRIKGPGSAAGKKFEMFGDRKLELLTLSSDQALSPSKPCA
jgi:hypothetical protein